MGPESDHCLPLGSVVPLAMFLSKLPQMKTRTVSRRAHKPHYSCVRCADSIFANVMQDMWKTQNVKCKTTTSTAGSSKNLRVLPTAN